MPLSIFPSFFYYYIIVSITPGPANLTSLSTALRHGKKIALRQWRGLFTGYWIVSLTSAFISYFIGTGFADYVHYFSFIGALYILYLAIHILRDNSEVNVDNVKKKQSRFAEGTFLFGVFVQLTNVKIMISCLTAMAAFVLPYSTSLRSLLFVACLLPLTGPTCNLVWLFAGVKLQTVFQKHRKLINILMAISLIFCAINMVI